MPNTTAVTTISIQKAEMRDILNKIMQDKNLFAPVSNGKVTDFLQVSNVEDVLMGDEITYKSPKEFFFPRSEKIIEFSNNEAIESKPEKGVVVFGVRPCDLEALKVMEKVFTTGKFADPFFKAHIDNTVVIGVGCLKEKAGCFCSQRETDMSFSEECDLFLANKEDSYEVVYVSEKGKTALSSVIPQLEGFENTKKEKSESKEKQLSFDNAIELETEAFDKVNWDKITEICQGCGMCTYICPTCHCFGFKDIEENGKVSRYRCWDSCMFPKFTLHASGHNPRESKTERYRQRVLHKYLYVKKNFGHVACTGCGRCVRSCPAGMNIKSVVEGIMEELS